MERHGSPPKSGIPAITPYGCDCAVVQNGPAPVFLTLRRERKGTCIPDSQFAPCTYILMTSSMLLQSFSSQHITGFRTEPPPYNAQGTMSDLDNMVDEVFDLVQRKNDQSRLGCSSTAIPEPASGRSNGPPATALDTQDVLLCCKTSVRLATTIEHDFVRRGLLKDYVRKRNEAIFALNACTAASDVLDRLTGHMPRQYLAVITDEAARSLVSTLEKEGLVEELQAAWDMYRLSYADYKRAENQTIAVATSILSISARKQTHLTEDGDLTVLLDQNPLYTAGIRSELRALLLCEENDLSVSDKIRGTSAKTASALYERGIVFASVFREGLHEERTI